MTITIRALFINISFLLFIAIVQAQVTIGSDAPPRAGTLVDLKEDGASTGKTANSVKGLGLPRVKLQSATTLTVDDNSEKHKYVGLMVYNTNTEAGGIAEGIYCWDGATWKQAIVTDSKGTSGHLLISKGDGTYSWKEATVPQFNYHKPTQILLFADGTATLQSYPYQTIIQEYVDRNVDSYLRRPANGTFNNKFVYTIPLTVSTDAATGKFLLLGLTVNIYKHTIMDKVAIVGYHETTRIEIYLNDKVIKTYDRTYSTPRYGATVSYLDVFSAIPLNQIAKGTYTLKVKISNVENRFYANETNANNEANQGKFYSGTVKFYDTSITDFGLVLYENLQ